VSATSGPEETPTAGHTPQRTSSPEPTIAGTEEAETQGPEETSEPEDETPDPQGTVAGEQTEEPELTASPDVSRTPQRTTTPPGSPTVKATEEPAPSATPDECGSQFATLVFGNDLYLEAGDDFGVEISLSNEGSGAAKSVVVGFAAMAGGEFLDEGVFGNSQLWWPHGASDAAVIYALGDIDPGATTIISLEMSMMPSWGDGDGAAIRANIADAHCAEALDDEALIAITHEDVGTPKAATNPTAETTAAAQRTASHTATANAASTPTPESTQTAGPASTPTAVPTSTSTPAGAAPNAIEFDAEATPARIVLGEAITPEPSVPPSPPAPLGVVLPGTGEGANGIDTSETLLIALAALSAACILAMAMIMGRRAR
jgi:hypothetical protein